MGCFPVERGSTFTFSRDLQYIASILFTCVKSTCVRTSKLCGSGNRKQPTFRDFSAKWRLWLVMPRGNFASTNQKHYPALGSDTSSVWNFCSCSSVAKKSAVFQAKGLREIFLFYFFYRLPSCHILRYLSIRLGQCWIQASLWRWSEFL